MASRVPRHFRRDLSRLPADVRQALEANFLDGTEPDGHPALIAALEGDFTKAAELYNNGQTDIVIVQRFIRTHYPDKAWGSEAYRRRWTYYGGWRRNNSAA